MLPWWSCPKNAPPASYVLAESAPGDSVEMGGKRATSIALDPARRLDVRLGRALGNEDYVVCVHSEPWTLHDRGWSGRCNHIVSFDRIEGWFVIHAGHAMPFLLNGREECGRAKLFDGDRISPCRGLVFTFSCPTVPRR